MVQPLETIVFATGNKGKLAEVQMIAKRYGCAVIGPKDMQRPTELKEVEETGRSYLANAKLKAEACFKWSGLASLGDDSGLEVDSLAGRPGLFTARYAGPNANSKQNIAKLLSVLGGVKERTARFRCVLFVRISEKVFQKSEGILEGVITLKPRGEYGFGYDPIFEIPGTGKTLAEMKNGGVEVKTHRIIACEKLFDILS